MASDPTARLDQAVALVSEATRLAVAARRDLPGEAVVRKPDGSAVTAVDVALQVLILDELDRLFGASAVIAEEDLASIGGKPAAEAHCRALLRDWGFAGGEERLRWALSIGGTEGSTRGIPRCWVLDPIDGTEGFLDGAHWCPCLALLERGEVVFAANGHPTIAGGVVFAAEHGSGTWSHALAGGARRRVVVRSDRPSPDEFIRVVAPMRATEAQSKARRAVGESTGHAVELIHADSQAKYGLVLAGEADVAFSRRGGGPGKFVWDHAGAIVLAREAGAWIGDTDGKPIDCGLGRRLGGNDAVICTARGLGPAIAAALAGRDRAEGFASR